MSLEKEINSIYEELEEDTGSLWLISFTDLISLILSFFILYYSITSIKEENFLVLKSKNQFKGDALVSVADKTVEDKKEDIEDIKISQDETGEAHSLNYLAAILQGRFAKEIPAKYSLVVKKEPERIIISILSDELFAKNTANLNEEAKQVIYKISENLKNLDNQISVIGYSDSNDVTKSLSHPSSWELSLERVNSIANEVSNFGYENQIKMIVSGGKTVQVGNKAASKTEKRMVDIVIHDIKYIR